jgi:hypothetical protein
VTLGVAVDSHPRTVVRRLSTDGATAMGGCHTSEELLAEELLQTFEHGMLATATSTDFVTQRLVTPTPTLLRRASANLA